MSVESVAFPERIDAGVVHVDGAPISKHAGYIAPDGTSFITDCYPRKYYSHAGTRLEASSLSKYFGLEPDRYGQGEDGMKEEALGFLLPCLNALNKRIADKKKQGMGYAPNFDELRKVEQMFHDGELPYNLWSFLRYIHNDAFSYFDLVSGADIVRYMINMNQSHQPRLLASGIITVVHDGEIVRVPAKEILVRAAGWAAIEQVPGRTLTTAHPTPYARFFDWAIMGYDIQQVPQLVFDEEEGRYMSVPTLERKWRWLPECEETAREEIRLVRKIPPNERARFFRSRRSAVGGA